MPIRGLASCCLQGLQEKQAYIKSGLLAIGLRDITLATSTLMGINSRKSVFLQESEDDIAISNFHRVESVTPILPTPADVRNTSTPFMTCVNLEGNIRQESLT